MACQETTKASSFEEHTGGQTSLLDTRSGCCANTSSQAEARAKSPSNSGSQARRLSSGCANTRFAAAPCRRHVRSNTGARPVRIIQCGIVAANSTRDGSAVSRRIDKRFTRAMRGDALALLCGSETMRRAAAAAFTETRGPICLSTSTTSNRSRSKRCGLSRRISCCFAKYATYSSTQGGM